MTSINGTLTESLDPTDWVAYAHRIDTGALVGMANVIAGAFSIDCGTVAEPCLVTVVPKMGTKWKPGEVLLAGVYRVPTAPGATPYFYKAANVATQPDPYLTNTALALRCNGADGSTAFADDSNYAHTVTANGNAKISTAQSKVGGASALFDGTGDYLTIPDSAAFNFGAGDFTLEFWVRFNSVAGTAFLQQSSGTSGYVLKWGLYWQSNQLVLSGHNPASTSLTWGAAPWTPIANTWYHVAVCRSGTTLRFFVDGNLIGSATTSVALPDASGVLSIGHYYDGLSGVYDLNGYLDNIRIINGLAIYTANFTPPTQEVGTVISPTGATEPAWPTVVGNTVIDGGVTWQCVSRMIQPLTHGPLIPA